MLWLVNQLWVIVPVNPWKNRASSELLYKSNRPQVSTGYINNSRHLARKYAWIFVRLNHLFREVNSSWVIPKGDLVYQQYCLLPAPKHTLKIIISYFPGATRFPYYIPSYIRWSTRAQFYGHEELSLALHKVSDSCHKIKLCNPVMIMTDFFFSCWMRCQNSQWCSLRPRCWLVHRLLTTSKHLI